MKIGIIGGSAAGLYSAILIKKKHPDFSVVLLEKNQKLGKKLAATGNGHCNLLNRKLSSSYYFDNPLVYSLLQKHTYSELEKTLANLGISTVAYGDLVYPLSYHAPSYVQHLHLIAEDLGVEIASEETVLSYEASSPIQVKTDKRTLSFDKIVICTGGASQKNLGSDGVFFNELSMHGYRISELKPGLCPIRVNEKLKMLSGLRHKASVRVFSSGRLVYGESGEILFKDDGLSGIAIMNASSYINHLKEVKNIEIRLDLFPSFEDLALRKLLLRCFMMNPKHFLKGILEKPLLEYVLYFAHLNKKEVLDEGDIAILAKAMKNLPFHFKETYSFDSSQVTIGGVDLTNIDGSCRSKLEENVYFAGEVLDVDGICGGYNLAFALLSSLEVSETI